MVLSLVFLPNEIRVSYEKNDKTLMGFVVTDLESVVTDPKSLTRGQHGGDTGASMMDMNDFMQSTRFSCRQYQCVAFQDQIDRSVIVLSR